MKKFTYANELVLLGNIIDENEHGYTVEYEDNTIEKGFKDTMFLEKELTVVEELNEKETTIADYNGPKYKGIAVKGKKYTYLVFESDTSKNLIHVISFEENEKGMRRNYHWDIKKDTLKGSGGVNKRVMDVVKTML